MIPVTCGSCLHEFEVPDIRAGVTVLCPPCGSRVDVPRLGEDAEREARRQQEQLQLQQQLEMLEQDQGQEQGQVQGQGQGHVQEQEQPAPELVGARVADDLHSLYVTASPRRTSSASRPAMTARSWSPGPGTASHAAATWEEPGAGNRDDGSRPFKPHVEDATRRTNLFRIGLALTIAFLAPIAGVPGHGLAFPQFSGLSQMPGAMVLLMLLPLVAGVTLMTMSKRASLPQRGIVTLASGVLMLLLMLINGDARSSVGQSMGVVPASAGVSGLLFLLGAIGLFVSARLRWYRPLHERAYLIGAVAAGCYLLYLFIPTNGHMPLAEPFQTFRISKLMGLGMLSHVGLMTAAAVLCLINTPATFGWQASNRAGRAFVCMVGAVAIPVIMLILSAMSMPSSMHGPMAMHGASMGSPAMMLISTALKFGVMYGGLALLIPIGVVDLMVGRP